MSRLSLLMVAHGAALSLSMVSGCLAAGDTSTDGGDPTTDTASVDDVLPLGAEAVCRVLFSCRDDTMDIFFAPVARAEAESVFFDLKERVPPAATLSEADCPALVEEIHRRKGLGPFIEAAGAGLLTFEPDGLQGCLQQLYNASCGADARNAIFDSTCFGLEPPEGGEQQRRMFSRASTSGACQPLADGFGGLFFGTCDPTRAFCCVQDASGACGIPGTDDEGACAAAAQEGEACSPFAPVLPCATGLECILGAGPDGRDGCLAPSTTPLALGEACYDGAQFRLLGLCEAGWCDVLGSDVCEPLVARGGACTSGAPCGEGAACVDSVCADNQTCGG